MRPLVALGLTVAKNWTVSDYSYSSWPTGSCIFTTLTISEFGDQERNIKAMKPLLVWNSLTLSKASLPIYPMHSAAYLEGHGCKCPRSS